jgi:hypothetical protein
MDILFVTARVLHVGLGVFWAGAMVFMAAFIVPSVRDAGPDGAKVAAGLMRRRLTDVMPIAAFLTILSGLYLYWRVSGGFGAAYMGSPMGMTYGVGAVAAVVALVVGLGVIRPSMLRAAAISRQMAEAPEPDRDRLLGEAQSLRARAASAGQVVAWLLVVAVIAMAVGRYV